MLGWYILPDTPVRGMMTAILRSLVFEMTLSTVSLFLFSFPFPSSGPLFLSASGPHFLCFAVSFYVSSPKVLSSNPRTNPEERREVAMLGMENRMHSECSEQQSFWVQTIDFSGRKRGGRSEDLGEMSGLGVDFSPAFVEMQKVWI